MAKIGYIYSIQGLVAKVKDTASSKYRKSGNFRCKNIFVVDGGYEN